MKRATGKPCKADTAPPALLGTDGARPTVYTTDGHSKGAEETRNEDKTAIEQSKAVPQERRSKEEFANYVEERNRLRELIQTGGQFYHKWLLGISGGALGLSMTFVNDLIGPDKAVETASLVAAWSMFAGSAAVILGNQLLGYYAVDRMLSILDQEFGGEEPDFFTRAHDRQVRLRRHHVCEWMDYLSLALFVAGVICLGHFVTVNY